MRNQDNVFHLAIPCHDLEAAAAFYSRLPNCTIARTYPDRITMNFFGDQVVCHKSPIEAIDKDPKMYPRHFGVTFKSLREFDETYACAREHRLAFFQDRFLRFEGKTEEHETFFLKDPSNNLLEFKYYKNSAMMY